MSVESEILRIQHNIANTYAAVSEKGGEVPLQPNSANLAAAVASIPSGSGGGGTLLNSLNRQIAITQSQWTEVDGVYQCIVPCDGVIANEAVQNIYSTPAASQQSTYEECGVKCVAQGTGTLTYQAKALPPDLLMYVTIVNASEITTNLVAWSPEMTGNARPVPYVVSNNAGSVDAWHMFDNNDDTAFPFSSKENFVTFDFGVNTSVYGFVFHYASKFIVPTSFTISGSADGIEYLSIQDFTINTSFVPDITKLYEYKFNKPANYRYYKFHNFEKKEGSLHNAMFTDILFIRPASDVEEVS